MREPSGLNEAATTAPVSPLSSSATAPVRASEISTLPSSQTVRMREPSGLNDALRTPLFHWEFEQDGARSRVPDLRRRRSVLISGGDASGEDAGAVGAERRASHHALLPDEIERGRARPRVPDLRRPVDTTGGDERGVGAERRTCHFARVPIELEQELARARVPDLRRPFHAAGDDAGAVGAERAPKP